MKEIYSEIEIDAPASVVWDILTDFDNYAQWNPFIKEISGNLIVGTQIEVFIKPPNSNGMKFRPKLLSYKPEEELRWLGKLWIPKLFDGEHSLAIKKIDENKVIFIQKEKFSGLFVPLVPGILKNTESGFKMMNQALKNEAEKRKI
jgi:hypothetical protein